MFQLFKKLFKLVENLGKPAPKTVWSDVSQELVGYLPKYSHTVGGVAHDPMNLILVGNRSQIDAAFRAAEWVDCDAPTPWNLVRAFLSGLFGLRYSTGPATPMMADGQLQDLTYQKSTAKRPNFRKRHHIRLWQTQFKLKGGLPVWVGAASYDKGMKLTYKPLFVTHRIDANIDEERDFVAQQLAQYGAKLAGTQPLFTELSGKNAYHDPYHTDGFATIIKL